VGVNGCESDILVNFVWYTVSTVCVWCEALDLVHPYLVKGLWKIENRRVVRVRGRGDLKFKIGIELVTKVQVVTKVRLHFRFVFCKM